MFRLETTTSVGRRAVEGELLLVEGHVQVG
jgi:hypothetical protein